MVESKERGLSGYFHSFHAQVEAMRQELEVDDHGEINELLKKFWEVEEVPTNKLDMSPHDKEVYAKTLQSITYDGERYIVKLPFNERKIEEPSADLKKQCKAMALRRLKSIENKLLRGSQQDAKEYIKVLQGYQNKQYTTQIEEDKAKWFIPHFAVIKEDRETTKVRIVMDAAAKAKGISLNDMIDEGPKLHTDQFRILIRFRKNDIAMTSDIKEMYPGIGHPEEDRPYLCFLWRALKIDEEPKVYAFNRAIFGVNASPFIALLTLREHVQKYKDVHPRAYEALATSTYVDDLLDSVETVEEALRLKEDITSILKEAGWIVHKWATNEPQVLKEIPETERAREVRALGDVQKMKTLGVLWDSHKDVFKGRTIAIPSNVTLTKRTVLQKLASVYDPLGIMTPFIIQCKVLLQQIWIRGCEWDTELDDDLRQKAVLWLEQLQEAENIEVDRVLLPKRQECDAIELHCFSDASESAYGCITYLRIQRTGGLVETRWVAAKSKVCPTKAMTIPKLELSAAVKACELAAKIKEALGEDFKTIFWTDSMTTLYWIKGISRQYKAFVANRVAVIHDKSEPSQWRHVPGKENPADVISRGCGLSELRNAELYWNGPEFLKLPPDQWPPQEYSATSTAQQEVRKEYQDNMVMFLESQGVSGKKIREKDNQEEEDTEHVFCVKEEKHQDKLKKSQWRLNPTRFSSWKRLVRVQAWVKRYLHNLREKEGNKYKGELSPAEVREAEVDIISRTQMTAFCEEYKKILQGKPLKGGKTKLAELNPKVDAEGILRMDGRLSKEEDLPWETRNPTILPKQNHVTDLIIAEAHEESDHGAGCNQLLATLRRKYWILASRDQIKSILHRCMVCRKRAHKALPQRRGELLWSKV